MGKDYSKDSFDLKELDEHNKIEHDGSLIRMLIVFKDLPYNVNRLLD